MSSGAKTLGGGARRPWLVVWLLLALFCQSASPARAAMPMPHDCGDMGMAASVSHVAAPDADHSKHGAPTGDMSDCDRDCCQAAFYDAALPSPPLGVTFSHPLTSSQTLLQTPAHAAPRSKPASLKPDIRGPPSPQV
ncbi:hypothetical protein [Phenylobacterium sp.]|uniref:hypothetical protein n=1 Tax=Phenylobacterium sp. TaxID=1871053 RepID=UPI0027354D57|nr:hypothetical protein [Phenylobacterium sp.]MDP3659678.1 hypothetical protein [Phenylobacterium sp.]